MSGEGNPVIAGEGDDADAEGEADSDTEGDLEGDVETVIGGAGSAGGTGAEGSGDVAGSDTTAGSAQGAPADSQGAAFRAGTGAASVPTGVAAGTPSVLPQAGVDEHYLTLLATGGLLMAGGAGLLVHRRRFGAHQPAHRATT